MSDRLKNSSKSMTADETYRPRRQRKRLEAALTVIVAQLLAVVLLLAGNSVTLALGVATAAGTLFLTRRLLWKAGLWIADKVRSLALFLYGRLLDRRTYRFGMRSLLLAILIIALLSAWFGYRYRAVSLEKHLLHGRWLMFNRDDKPMIKPDGTPYIFDFSEASYAVDPLSEPKRIDFHTPQGVSHAIYRWEGDDIVITQVSPGGGRPVDFHSSDMIREPGTAGPGEVSVGTYRLRRSND
jgi:hypothetical protein